MLKRNYEEYERAHELVKLEGGPYTCNFCKLYWSQRPKTFCAGVPVYRYGCWPEDLYTRTQLRRMKYWPRNPEQPDGAYFIRKSPYRRWLYSLAVAQPWRTPTPAQQVAIVKWREGLVVHYTCRNCGWYDTSHGKAKYVPRIRDGWCADCWKEFHRRKRQIAQCAWARSYVDAGPFFVLDSDSV